MVVMSDRKLKLSVVFEAVDKASSRLSGIGKSASSIGKQLAVANKELKDLNATQKDISGFRKLKTAVGENTKKLAEAQAKVAQLSREFKQAEKPTREMERALNRAKKEAGELAGKIDKDSQSLQRMRDKLKGAGVNTRDLAKDQRDLTKRIGEATASVEKQKDAYAKVMAKGGKGSGSSNNGPGTTTDRAVKAGLILGTIKEASDIAAAPVIADAGAQEQMTQIGIKADLSREKLQAMREEIARIAPLVRKRPEELRMGIDFLAASGLNPTSALKMMEPIAKASHAYMGDITELSQAANAALTNLKIPMGKDEIDRTRQTARTLEIMAKAGKEGNFEFNDMAKSFPTLTARMAALGQEGVRPVADLSAALQVAWKATGNADTAANNIDNLLLKLNTKDTIKNFEKVGIDLPKALKKAYSEGKGPLEAIAELTQKATGGNLDKLSNLFGDEQAQTGVLSLIANLKEYRRIRDETLSSSSAGMIDRDFATRAQDQSSRWEGLISRWGVLKEKMGELLRGASGWAMGKADADLQKLNEQAKWIGDQIGSGVASGMETKSKQVPITKWWLTQQDAGTVQARSILIGNHVGDGLAIGMMQRRDQVRAAANALTNEAQNEARRNLQVRSPSRVFMQIGSFVADGMALGIDKGRRNPIDAIGRMANGVAAAGAMSAARMGPSVRPVEASRINGGSSGPVTINVHAAPGMDIPALAREVGREWERTQARTDRSSFKRDR